MYVFTNLIFGFILKHLIILTVEFSLAIRKHDVWRHNTNAWWSVKPDCFVAEYKEYNRYLANKIYKSMI